MSSSGSATGLLALGLGANLGRPEEQLREAVRQLRRHLADLRVAPLYRSAPISPVEQGDFLNSVALAPLPTGKRPRDLLDLARELEARAERRSDVRWGPRTLDVDLLLWGEATVRDEDLVVPHPRLAERRFVLAPLADLEPDLVLPGDGRTVSAALADLGPEQRIERIGWTGEPP